MKTRLEISNEMLEANRNDLIALELREMFLQRRVIANDSPTLKYELGKVQNEVKSTKEWIEFLEEKIKNKFK